MISPLLGIIIPAIESRHFDIISQTCYAPNDQPNIDIALQFSAPVDMASGIATDNLTQAYIEMIGAVRKSGAPIEIKRFNVERTTPQGQQRQYSLNIGLEVILPTQASQEVG